MHSRCHIPSLSCTAQLITCTLPCYAQHHCHGTSFSLTEGLSTSPYLPRYLSDRSHDLWTMYIAQPLWSFLVSFPLYATTVLSPKSHSSPHNNCLVSPPVPRSPRAPRHNAQPHSPAPQPSCRYCMTPWLWDPPSPSPSVPEPSRGSWTRPSPLPISQSRCVALGPTRPLSQGPRAIA